MKAERKVFFLHLSFGSASQSSEADEQLNELEKLLNDGWNVLQAVPLSATGGMAAVMVTQGAPGEATRFAEWAGLVVLERASST